MQSAECGGRGAEGRGCQGKRLGSYPSFFPIPGSARLGLNAGTDALTLELAVNTKGNQ